MSEFLKNVQPELSIAIILVCLPILIFSLLSYNSTVSEPAYRKPGKQLSPRAAKYRSAAYLAAGMTLVVFWVTLLVYGPSTIANFLG